MQYDGRFYQFPPYHIKFGSRYPFPSTVSHEFTHAENWLTAGGDPSEQLLTDFQRLSNDRYDIRTAGYAGLIMMERYEDRVHWPHFLHTYIARIKTRMPPWFRDKWFYWMKDRRVILPLAIAVTRR